MCGIVGMATLFSDQIDVDLLRKMRDTMKHRGPDDLGIWLSRDKRVGLAHRRLSIIDLSQAGHQPMCDTRKHFCISFNGEIYNYLDIRTELKTRGHKFNSNSDTEVILESYRAWGKDFIMRLNGMFAFAIYDSVEQCIILGRDRAGEKPLFYYHKDGIFAFASELKALLVNPLISRKLDPESLDFYLAYGYVPGDKCIIKDVQKLPQGHYAVYDCKNGKLALHRYWLLPENCLSGRFDENELLQDLECLLQDAVQKQLIADVPVGVLLSGGIDSSLVTAMAARVSSKPVKTFNVSFPGHGNYDESPYARLVAAHFGTDHTELVAEPASVDLLPELARQYDEPIADSSMIPTYMVSKLIRQSATVALGGDGGDELFGGYLRYTRLQLQERIKQFFPKPLRWLLYWGGERILPIGLPGRNYLLETMLDCCNRISYAYVFDEWARRNIVNSRKFQGIGLIAENYKMGLCNERSSLVQKATTVDFKTYLVDDILVKVDRASMLASLEIRSPWLDYRIIEFAFSRVPDCLKMKGNARKVLLRLLAKRLLPSQLDLNRKWGFGIPLHRWFSGKWGNFVEEILTDSESDLFNPVMIRKLIDTQKKGYSNMERLFCLLLFELWRREYKISL